MGAAKMNFSVNKEGGTLRALRLCGAIRGSMGAVDAIGNPAQL
jgi:hypothetical protein